MAIDFPNSPSAGQIYTVNGKQWIHDTADGGKWKAYGASLAPDILKVDSANNRVGINQTTPTVALDVTGSARITGDLTVSGTTVTVDLASVLVKDRIVFEGSSADAYETTLIVTNPTGADKTITLPNADGTVAMLTDNVASATLAATATILANARTIGGVSFNGSANIVPDQIAVETTSQTGCSVALFDSATGNLQAKTDAGITYNASTNALSATTFSGALSGNATTATQLAASVTIGGVTFTGAANINLPGVNAGGSQDTSGNATTATTATNVTVADTTDTTCFVGLFEADTGNLPPKSDAGMTYNAGTGTLTMNTGGGGYEGPHIVGMPAAKSTHYTLVLADAGKMIRMNSASANTLTIPNNSSVVFPIGTQILINVMNTGTTTIAGVSGVVLDSKDDNEDIDGRYSTVALIKTETNNWTLTGPLA